MLFNRRVLVHRPLLPQADFLHAFAARELVERLSLVSRQFTQALVCGPLTPTLRGIWRETELDLRFASPSPGEAPDLVADVMQPIFRTMPLTLSLNELHLANDPVTMLGELRGTLRPDGLFLGAALTSGSLGELSDALMRAELELSEGAAVRIAPLADVRNWGDALARAGFALPVGDEVRLTVRYDRLGGLMRDLHAMGVRKVLADRSPAPRRLFVRAEAIYRHSHSDPDGRLRATFAFAFLSGWAPDPSQQRPAPRGSANVRLEDALNALDREAPPKPRS